MNPMVNRLVDRALHQPVCDFKRRQGKRIRGLLVQIAYEMAGGRGHVSQTIAEAIECLHAGSLIIDDIQDDSQLRRGQPTLHTTIGVPLAINAGNWMYFRALQWITDTALPVRDQSKMMSAMVNAGLRCHEGQAIDLIARIDQLMPRDWGDTVKTTSTLKTGVLVELAVAMACIAADASNVLQAALTSFGSQIGVALQMRNDLHELYQAANMVGESTFNPDSDRPDCLRDDDLRHARVTWPWAWAAALVGETKCRKLVEQLFASTTDRCSVASELFQIVSVHGDRVIVDLVSDQVRMLGEHVVDGQLLSAMRECLMPIQQPCDATESRSFKSL